MSTCVALIRGINVGRAKRMAMADLRGMLEDMGHTNVRTVLNSGNAVFQTQRADVRDAASAIEDQIVSRFGFKAAVVVITSGDLADIIDGDPLGDAATDHARYLVAFVSDPASLSAAKPLLSRSWGPERFALGSKAAYLWCPKGVTDSSLAQAFAKLMADAATTRNWATVLKVQAAARSCEAAT